MNEDTNRDLLFGLIALQVGLIDQGRLVAAFQAWTRDKGRPLAEHLDGLDDADRAAIEALVERHLAKHAGDLERSLASIPIGGSTRERLADLGDPQLNATLDHIPERTTEPEVDRTATYSFGAASSGGQRFRVLRPHAQGGLGAVFVALDGELSREVALKRILDQRADDTSSRQRFLVEAEITGGLEHPGIVPVYGLGASEDGRPYYAMRFIKGDSLKQAIARFHADASLNADPSRRSLELRQLLRQFLDVCNALEYAHARGVLHRDIKPGNIIVGKYGETLVVDWGLAKPLGQADPLSDERALVPSSASGSAETLPGKAIGTPGYMSPEQARGDLDKLGPWSDVYSLGATLYCLLTGRPPFQGTDLGSVLRAVERGDFSPPRQLDPTIDKALEAICLKAMALAPEKRYASCQALANDLDRWLADEPVDAYPEPWTRKVTRWVSRHRTGVATAAAALVVGLVGVGAVAVVQTQGRVALAEKNLELVAANEALDLQRQRAEERELQAIEAVERFSDVVVENPMLKNSPELEELRKTLLNEPLEFFRSLRDQLQADNDTRPESLVRLASAAFGLGNLSNEIGDKQDALAAIQESLAIRRQLAEEHPAVTQYQSDLATSHNNLGAVLSATGDIAGARRAYEAALTIWQRLIGAHPTDTKYRQGLARSHHNLGNVLSATGDIDEARRAYEAALTIQQRLIEAHPTDTEYQSDLAASHYNFGLLLRATGDIDEARRAHEAALAIRQRLAEANPSVTGYQSDLADSHNNLGALLDDTGDPAGARRAYEAALVIWRQLTEDHPSITEYQEGLAASYNNLGGLLRATGDIAGARRAYESTLAIHQRLAEANPSVTGYQSDLAASYHNLGFLLRATGDIAGARRAYEATLAIMRQLAEDYPENPKHRRDLARSHLSLGILMANSGDIAGARQAYEASLAIQRQLAKDYPTVPIYRRELARGYINLGVVLRGTGDVTGARRAYEAALAINQRLAEEHPAVVVYRRDLAMNYNNLGNALSNTGDVTGARRAFEAALAIRRQLVEDHPESPQYASDLGGTFNNLATIDLNARRFAEARDQLREAIRWQKKALAANPRNPTYRQFLRNHYANLRIAAQGLSDAALAAEAERGLAELQASDPRFQALNARLEDVLNGDEPHDKAERLALAQHAHETERYGAAAQLWAEALRIDPSLAESRQSPHRYNAACAAALAGTGQGVDDPAPDTEARARLRDQALRWLQAERAAWSVWLETASDDQRAAIIETLQWWQQDPDLAGVREPEALAALPDAERTAWEMLWLKVKTLAAQANGAAAASESEPESDEGALELPKNVFATGGGLGS